MNLGSILNMMNFVSLIASIFIMIRLWRFRKRANLSGLIVYFISEIAGNILVLLSSLSLTLHGKLFFFNYLFAFFVMGACGWYIWLESFVMQRRGISRLGWAMLLCPLLIFIYVSYAAYVYGPCFLLINPAVKWYFGYPFLVFESFTSKAMLFVGVNQFIVAYLTFVAFSNIDRMKTIKKKYYFFSIMFSVLFFLFFGAYAYYREKIPFISIFDVGLFSMMFVKFFILYKPSGGAAVNLNMMDRYDLLEKMQQGMFVIDRQGEILDFNLAGKNILKSAGLPEFNPKDNFFAMMSTTFPSFNLETDCCLEKEYVVELPGQAALFFEVEIDVIRQPAETANEEQYIIFIRDITESRSQELNLLIFRAAFYAMDDMMLICNSKRQIEYASMGFTKNTGYSESQVKGRYFLELKENDDNVFSTIEKSMASKESWSGYVRSLKHDGQEMLEKMAVSPIFDVEERPVGFAVISKDITAEHCQAEQLEKEAREDFLTKIDNRRTFTFFAKPKMELAQIDKEPIAVLMLDIDFFKSINDTYGHDAGDEVLRQLARLVKSMIRKGDLFARYGGEEFIMMVSGMSENTVMCFAERIRQQMENMVIDYDGLELRLTISIGVCFSMSAELPQLQMMIKRSDEALYFAKNQGRNRVALWHPKQA